MVDASVDAWEMDPSLVGGRSIRVCGPIGRAVGDEHSERYLAELIRLAENEDRITIRDRGGMSNPNIYVDGGHVHAYITYSVLGQEPDVDTDLWTSTTRVIYATDLGYYDILCESGKAGVYRNPEFCAATAINAVKAHMAVNFAEVPVTEQYTKNELEMYIAAQKQFRF